MVKAKDIKIYKKKMLLYITLALRYPVKSCWSYADRAQNYSNEVLDMWWLALLVPLPLKVKSESNLTQ